MARRSAGAEDLGSRHRRKPNDRQLTCARASDVSPTRAIPVDQGARPGRPFCLPLASPPSPVCQGQDLFHPTVGTAAGDSPRQGTSEPAARNRDEPGRREGVHPGTRRNDSHNASGERGASRAIGCVVPICPTLLVVARRRFGAEHDARRPTCRTACAGFRGAAQPAGWCGSPHVGPQHPGVWLPRSTSAVSHSPSFAEDVDGTNRRDLPLSLIPGTRHRSAASFCAQQTGQALAIVVSQDGDVSLFDGNRGRIGAADRAVRSWHGPHCRRLEGRSHGDPPSHAHGAACRGRRGRHLRRGRARRRRAPAGPRAGCPSLSIAARGSARPTTRTCATRWSRATRS